MRVCGLVCWKLLRGDKGASGNTPPNSEKNNIDVDYRTTWESAGLHRAENVIGVKVEGRRQVKSNSFSVFEGWGRKGIGD